MTGHHGVKVLEERGGEGATAQRGDRVVFNSRIVLNRGEEVPPTIHQPDLVPRGQLRSVDGTMMVDHQAVLGTRDIIAGIERSLIGMKVGGYRKVRISPHLAYRDKGIPGVIPPNAVLTVELWLQQVVEQRRGVA
ncbi:MAG: FKBP-type peptidyl-prolyl cis-trans isomerase [Nitrospiraceae bacterium]